MEFSPVSVLGFAGDLEILEWGLPGAQPSSLQHYSR